MIEVAGFRYAVGRPAARAASGVVVMTAVSYALYITGAVFAWSGTSRAIVVSTAYVFAACYMLAVAAAFCTGAAITSADKQPVARARAAPTGGRLQRWWSSSEAAAWLRLTPIWLAVAIFAGLGGLALIKDHLGGVGYGAAVCAMAWLMAWNVRTGHRLARHLSKTSAWGDGQLFWMFDWDRFDVSDEGRFRQRFGQRRWKVPGVITHPAEADRYAARARKQRFAHMMASAGAALAALVFAEHTLSELLTGMGHDLVHLLDTPVSSEPSVSYYCSLAAAMFLFMLPVGLQYRAGEMDTLAKLYEGRSAHLLAERTAYSRPWPAPARD